MPVHCNLLDDSPSIVNTFRHRFIGFIIIFTVSASLSFRLYTAFLEDIVLDGIAETVIYGCITTHAYEAGTSAPSH